MWFSLYVFYWGNNQLYLRWKLAVVGSPVVAGGGIVLTPTGKATKKKSMWRLFRLKLTAGTIHSRHVSKIESFYSCGEQLTSLLEQRNSSTHTNQYSRCYIILGRQHGSGDVIWKRSMQYEFQRKMKLALHGSPRILVKRAPGQCSGCCRLESCSEAKHFFLLYN